MFKPAARADTRLANIHGIKRFDRVQPNARKPRRKVMGDHVNIVAQMNGLPVLCYRSGRRFLRKFIDQRRSLGGRRFAGIGKGSK
jgi:hypothetical protein